MEAQTGREPFRHSHRFRSKSGSRVRANARAESLVANRGVKREAGDEQKAGLYFPKSGSPLISCNDPMAMFPTAQVPNSKSKVNHSRAALEADAWLRDEPVAAVGRSCNGPGGNDCNTEIGGSDSVTDGASSPGCSSEKGDPAYLFALLRSTTIKESILQEGIERLGGGKVGLHGIIKAILFWLDAKERHNKSKSSESCSAHSEGTPLRDVLCKEMDMLVDDGNAKSLNHSSSDEPVTSSVKAPSSCGDGDSSLCDSTTGDSGSGEYDWLPACESQPPVFMGGSEATSGLSSGLRSQGSIQSSKEFWDPGVSGVRGLLRQDKVQRPMLLRKLSASPDRSGVLRPHDMYSFDETFAQQYLLGCQSNISPEYISPANEFQAFLNTATPEAFGAQGLYCGANPFGPFNLGPISCLPSEPHSMDFNAFGAQGHVLVDENLGLGSSIHGCGPLDRLGSLGHLSAETTSVDRKQSGPRLGLISKSKASPAACTRLARKQRMDRNRKAALYQVNRGAFENSAALTGKSGGICCTSRNTCGSQGSPSSDGPTNKTVDRRQHENLQFLLMKVLRPSDVGNLGRIVLPKKDAESHLPWLGAREGIQLPCEDYDTGEMMTLRYRFWPNNKSRMYLLENTGDFVKRHLLQESDRMLIYRNQSLGTYIIRARKAQDCVGGRAEDAVEDKPDQGQQEGTEGDGAEITEQDSPGGSCSSGTSSLSGTESKLGSLPEVSESCVRAPAVIISQDDMLTFADLPDAPMGEGTEQLVRFPSLESFDVELLDLAPVTEEDVSSCKLKATG